MTELSVEENLILRVAVATCFLYSLQAADVPSEDVDLYVDELLKLYAARPEARTGDPERPDLRSSLAFCATRLDARAPLQAGRLRAAIGGS